MLQIRNLSFSFGERFILRDANWIINPGKRVALIGPNGAGKTTLLRILTGENELQGGTILKPKEYRIGYLPQEEITLEQGSVLQCVLEGHRQVMELEEEIFAIHQAMDAGGEDNDLLSRLGVKELQYDALGGYQLETTAKALLSGLGFRTADFHRPLSDFSGGWRMRAYLARLLAQNPDLLLLDEPTNHLDFPSLEWLEQYLLKFPGSMIIVSHDRFFIDRLAQEITELDRGKLTHYPGNYHFYEQQKQLNEDLLLKRWEQVRAERERQQKFIDRFRYKATKAAQVQSRIKQLDKLQEVELPPPPRRFQFQISVPVHSFKDVLQIEDLSFRYDQDWVLQDISLQLYRGEKLALVGVNGAGKTTLTRLIFGQLAPQQGSLKIGERTSIGYYAQHQVDTLNLDATAFEEVAGASAKAYETKVRDVLGMFQFTGDEVYKPIRVLSGGEKARVSLAKILVSPVNFLIMDEPTNHLDLASKEALENALLHYDGTLLLISHDRYFLDKLVHRVIEIRDKQLYEYAGNYSYYLQRREQEAEEAVESEEKAPLSLGKKSKEQKRQEAEARQAISKERNRLQQEIKACEKQILALEKQKAEIEALMAVPDTYRDGELAASVQRDYRKVKEDLEALVAKWEKAQIAYEELLEAIV